MNLHVVFPTPPFPPTKIHLRLVCSRIDLKLASAIFGTTATVDDILLFYSNGKNKYRCIYIGFRLSPFIDRQRNH